MGGCLLTLFVGFGGGLEGLLGCRSIGFGGVYWGCSYSVSMCLDFESFISVCHWPVVPSHFDPSRRAQVYLEYLFPRLGSCHCAELGILGGK